MEKKIVLLKDLDQAQFPVVDILKTESEERLGCSTTAMVNWIIKMNLFGPDRFSNIAEMALYYERTFETKNGGVKAEICFSVIDEYIKEQKEALETLIFRADSVQYQTILVLLLNDFVGFLCSQNEDTGHCDIVFYEQGKVYFNAFEVNEEELAEILFSHKMNMMCFGRSLKTYKRFAMKSKEVGSFTVKLSEEQRYMLPAWEAFYLENDLMALYDQFPAMKIPDLIKEKELILKASGYLDKDLIVIYPPPTKINET